MFGGAGTGTELRQRGARSRAGHRATSGHSDEVPISDHANPETGRRCPEQARY